MNKAYIFLKHSSIIIVTLLLPLTTNAQVDPDTYLKAQLDYEINGVKKSAYEQEALRNRGSDLHDQYWKQSAEFAKKQGEAYKVIAQHCNYDVQAKPPVFSSREECEQYRKRTQQKLDEFYKNERQLDGQRPCYDCSTFDKMNNYIGWVNKLWPYKYKLIPLYKRKLELCNCNTIQYSVADKYDDQGRRILSKGEDILIEGNIGTIIVDNGDVFYNENTKQIEVPAGSSAHIVYNSDNVKFNLKENSRVTFESNMSLFVNKGDLAFRVNKKGGKFLIKTPSAIAGCFSREGFHGHQAPPLEPMNDEIEVDVVVSGNATEISVYKGQVTVSNNVSVVVIHGGEMISTSSMNEKLVSRPINNNNSNNVPNNYTNTLNYYISGDGWAAQKIKSNPTSIQNDISNAINAGSTPAGIYISDGSETEVYYIEGNPLNMTEWNLESYSDATNLQNGITSNIERGYFPMGISFTEQGNLYVLYIKSQVVGTGWQLAESELDLNEVSTNIQPWLNQQYIPVGITVYSGMYYTLLVQVPGTEVTGWTIEGYQNNNNEIKQNVNTNINSGLLPFGYLKEDGVVNVLYVGF